MVRVPQNGLRFALYSQVRSTVLLALNFALPNKTSLNIAACSLVDTSYRGLKIIDLLKNFFCHFVKELTRNKNVYRVAVPDSMTVLLAGEEESFGAGGSRRPDSRGSRHGAF